MSYKPRDLFPSTIKVARVFLREYDQVEEGKQEAKKELCERHGVPEKEAFRWIHVVRPHFREKDDSWPFYEDIESHAFDPSEYDDESKVDTSTFSDREEDDGFVIVETRTEMAELMDADPATVWRGVDQNRPAKDYPVHEWVRLDKKGHIDHFKVPTSSDLFGEEEAAGEEEGPAGEDADRQTSPEEVNKPLALGHSTNDAPRRTINEPEANGDGTTGDPSSEPHTDTGGQENEEGSTPGGWSWDKDYVYNAAQDTYLFHLSQYEGAPFVVEGDKLRRMVRRYSKHAGDRAWNLDEVAAAEGMPRDAWQEIKQNLGITHTSPPHLPEDFQREDDIEGMAADDVQKKKHEWKKHNEQKTYRELKTAADKWFKLEGVMEEASKELMSFLQDYEPPQVSVSSGGVGADSAALYNNQDWHIGARPHEGADQFSVQAYCDGLVEKSKQAIGDALNLRSLETFYMVVGGDLVHSDNFDGSTTKGTDLDMACGHAEAVKRAVETSIRVADLARSAADEVVILPVPGNHDRALSTAAALAVSHHYNQTDDVRCLPINERQYVTYYNHLMCVTHGDIKKKALRNIGDTIRAEARNEMGRTSFTTLATGHFHYRSRDVEDKSGRVHYQAPSPAPTDRWHNKEVFVGSRKGVQLVLLDQEDGGDHVIHA